MPRSDLELLKSMDGWCTLEKAEAIYDIIGDLNATLKKPICAVEIGTFAGKSLLPVAIAMRDFGNHGFVTGMDPYNVSDAVDGIDQDGDDGEHFRWWEKIDFDKMKRQCREMIEKLGLEAYCAVIPCRADACLDLFKEIHFIHFDDNHTRVGSTANAKAWLPKLVKGGVFILDDSDWATVQPARAAIQEKLQQIPPYFPTWEAYCRK